MVHRLVLVVLLSQLSVWPVSRGAGAAQVADGESGVLAEPVVASELDGVPPVGPAPGGGVRHNEYVGAASGVVAVDLGLGVQPVASGVVSMEFVEVPKEPAGEAVTSTTQAGGVSASSSTTAAGTPVVPVGLVAPESTTVPPVDSSLPTVTSTTSSTTSTMEVPSVPSSVSLPPVSTTLPVDGPTTTTVQPVAAPAAGRVAVEVLDEAVTARAGLDKLAFQVRGIDGELAKGMRVRVTIDYSSFRDAYGADWAGRLSVVEFDGCVTSAVSDDQRARCAAPRHLESVDNNVLAGTISFEVDLGETVERLGGVPVDDAAVGLRSVRSGFRAGSTGGPGYGLSARAYSYTGNFATSSLNPSADWSVGVQGGTFTWSYPIETFAAPAGAAPSVAVSYDSGAVDGLTADQNTQGGLLGPGWSAGEAFIERGFKSCYRDGGGTADLCWVDDNASLAMPGLGGRLIEIGGVGSVGAYSVQEYRTERDEGWVVRRYWKPVVNQGGFEVDAQGEYWVVNDLDGNEYWFGFGRSTGDRGADPGTELHSAWTVPVRSLQAGEPCYGQPSQWCHQTYRWMLDRVVDSNGRTTTYHYTVDKNHYGRLGQPANPTPYVLGGVLLHIEYGQFADTANVLNAETSRVLLFYRYRCTTLYTPNCPVPVSTSTATEFPDVPADQICDLNGSSTWCTEYTPTFFHTRVLDHVMTQRRSGPGEADWVTGRRYDFRYEWVDGDGTGPEPAKIWLRFIRPLDVNGAAMGAGSYAMAVRIDGWNEVRPNRSDHNIPAGVTPVSMWRVGGIINELGRDVRVFYTLPDPSCPGDGTGWSDNTRRCFNRWYVPPSGSAQFSIWNKYVVERVEVRDVNGRSPTMVHSYGYAGGMGWHSDFDPFNVSTQRGWSDYRGYERVTESIGAVGSPNRLTTNYRFFRGMHGSLLSHAVGGATKVASVTDFAGATWTDHPALAGRPLDLERVANDGTPLNGELTMYNTYTTGGLWGSTARDSTRVEVSEIRSRAHGGVRNQVLYGYHPSGALAWEVNLGKVSSAWANVDASWGNDDRCTEYWYTTPTVAFPRGLVSQRIDRQYGSCSGTPVIGEQRFFYDGSMTLGAAPTAGNLTRRVTYTGGGTVTAPSGSLVSTITDTWTFQNGARRGQASPNWARPATHTDPQGNQTQTTYTPTSVPTVAGNHNVTRVTTTKPLIGAAFVDLDSYGRPFKETDVNGRVTAACYDSWNRVTKVYLPGQTFASCTSANPSFVYDYRLTLVTPSSGDYAALGLQLPTWSIRRGELFSVPGDASHPSGVTTAVYLDSFDYYDGSGRIVQTQTPVHDNPTGERLLTQSIYDSRGLLVRQSTIPTWDAAAAGSGYKVFGMVWSPHDTEYSYDSLGRVTTETQRRFDVAIRTRTTSYSGYQTTTGTWTPTGGSSPYASTITEVDAYGNVVFSTTAGEQTTRTYDVSGNLRSVVDPGGATTTMTYNWLGWPLTVNDPDNGLQQTRYYATGQIERTIDARNQMITRSIDALGRTTTVRAGTSTGLLLAEYDHDQTGGLGAIDWIKSYQPAGVLAATSDAVTYNTAGHLTNYTTQVHAGNTAGTADDALHAAYTFQQTFTRNGSPSTITYPAVTVAGSTTTITHRAAEQATSGASGASSLTITKPTGTVTDDVLIASLIVNSSTVTITPPAGWTQVATINNGTDNRTVVYHRAAGTSEPASYAFGFSFNVKSAAIISAYSGVDTANPIDVTATGTNVLQTDQIAPTATTTAAATRVLRVWGVRKETSLTPPVGITERGDITATGSGAVAIAVGDAAQAAAGSTATATATSATAGIGAHLTIALRPAATSGMSLPSETLTYTYGSIGQHLTVDTNRAGTDDYISTTLYDGYNRFTGRNLRGNYNGLDIRTNYNPDGRTATITATVPTGPYAGHHVTNATYTYDDTGNITAITHDPDDTGTTPDELATEDQRECFFYDTRQRLARAYTYGRTQAGTIPGCSTTLTETNYTTASISETGPAAYDQVWVFDAFGNITEAYGMDTTTWNDRTFTSTSASTCAQGAVTRRHATAAITDMAGTTTTDTYTYDCAGSMTQHIEYGSPNITWTYTWDAHNRLIQTQQSGNNPSTNTYDATGQRLLRTDPDGTKTVYLGTTEIRFTTGTTQAARTYPGGVRRDFDTTVTYTATNHHNSIVGTNDNTDTLTRLRYTPYGNLRTGTPHDDKAFLNQTHDPAQNLIYLNNRYHDPTLGVFISVDPLVQMTGEPYIYASGNPTTLSDPSGLEPCPLDGCKWEDSGGRLPIARKAIPDHPDRGDWSACGAQNSTASYCDTASAAYWQQLEAVEEMSVRNAASTANVCSTSTAGGNLCEGVDGLLLLQIAFTVGTFTPCSAWCAAGAASVSSYQAYDTCSSEGWGTNCGVASAGAVVSVVAPVAGATSTGAGRGATYLATKTNAAAAGTRVTVTASTVRVSGGATRAYYLSAWTHYARQLEQASRNTQYVSTAADWGFTSWSIHQSGAR